MISKKNISHEIELSAWKYYLRQSVKVYIKNGMLRIGKNSWWSRIKANIPEDFADNFGRIREPWLTEISLGMRKYGLTISESLNIAVDNVVPSLISAIVAESQASLDLKTENRQE